MRTIKSCCFSQFFLVFVWKTYMVHLPFSTLLTSRAWADCATKTTFHVQCHCLHFPSFKGTKRLTRLLNFLQSKPVTLVSASSILRLTSLLVFNKKHVIRAQYFSFSPHFNHEKSLIFFPETKKLCKMKI